MLNHEGFYSVTIEKAIEPNSGLPLIKPVQNPEQKKEMLFICQRMFIRS